MNDEIVSCFERITEKLSFSWSLFFETDWICHLKLNVVNIVLELV